MRSTLAVLLLCAIGANAFTYTCNEVKKLIRDKTSFITDNACVSFDQFIPTDSGFPTEVYFQSGNGLKWSLEETATVGCVSYGRGPKSWTIVTDREDQGQDIDCTYEFTVFFSSIETHLITAKNDGLHHRSYFAYNYTVVAPRGGIMIDFSCNNTLQPLHFYTGLGNGAGEQMYYYGSSKCDDRLSIFAWDTAITISTPDDGYVLMTYWGAGGYLSLGSVSYDVLLMGSGRSSNIIQHGNEDKFMWLSPTISDDLKFHIDGFAEMDQKLGNSLVFTTKCNQNNCTGTTVPITDNDVHLILEADFLAVNYNTKVPDDQWKDDDLFFMRIATTPLNSTDVTEAPHTKANTDYSCDCVLTNGNADFASDLWVDVVFIVDVSQAMGVANINKALSMIESIASELTLDSAPQNPKFSRVGLVTVADKAETIVDFSSPYKSPGTLQPSTAAGANIRSGFVAAMQIFSHSSYRSARQILYIIAASDTNQISIEHAQEFKDNGGLIAVTELYSPHTFDDPLFDIGSPGYYTFLFNDNVNLDLKLLCDANCFCPYLYAPRSSDQDTRPTAGGGCYHTHITTNPYELARDACYEEGSVLTTVHDDDKQNFLLGLVSEYFGPKKQFWIGYEYNGSGFEWLDDSNSSYTKWASDQPDVKGGRCVYSQQTTGFNSGWFTGDCSTDKCYVCERAPCSVSNFCK